MGLSFCLISFDFLFTSEIILATWARSSSIDIGTALGEVGFRLADDDRLILSDGLTPFSYDTQASSSNLLR